MRSPSSRLVLSFPVSFLLLTTAVRAQQRLTLRDAVLKAGTEYAPERLKGLQWAEGANTYSYVKGDQLMVGTLGKSVDRAVVELKDINKQLSDTAQLKALPNVTWKDAGHFRFLHNERLYGYTIGSGTLEPIARIGPVAENEDVEPETGAVAFTAENDLYIARPGIGKNKPTPITSDGGNGIVNGQSVHRQEYGIVKGTFWSPNGNLLAFYRMDESMVTTYELENIGTKPSTFEPIRYPMAGQASHHVTIGVHDLRSGTTVFLKTGEPADQYLTNIGWEPDEKHLTVVHLDRKTENLRMVRYDVATGEPVGTLLTEHDDKYLEPQHPALFLKTRPSQFMWQSPRDGWDHLYLYDVKGGLVKQLTRGNWVVKEVIGMDPKEMFAIVSGTAMVDPLAPAGALETHLYRIDLRSGRTMRLTSDAGTHSGELSTDGSYLIDTWSSTTVPNRSSIIGTRNGDALKTMVDAKDPTKELGLGTIELLSIQGEQGDRLNARLIKPSHFDPSRKYPVLIYVYGGPHLQLVSNSHLAGASLWMMAVAERGYLVWSVDGHGTPSRRHEFEQAIHRRLGEVEVKDQVRGVEYLKSLPFVDGSRIAVHGWSFGGHMTTALLTRNPGMFKVGVAGGPVMDWSMYEVMYTERYMDTPAENPEGYASTALPLLASQLKDDLLIITGSKDDTVLPEHSYTFLKACVDKNVQVDFFAYPGYGHNVRGRDRGHLMEKVMRYIDQRIQPEGPPTH